MGSKITAQFIGFKSSPAIDGAVNALIAKQAAAVKVVNRFDLLDKFYKQLPAGSLIVYRDQAWQASQEAGFNERLVAPNGPAIEAQKWLDHHKPMAALYPRVYFEILNEWAGWNWDNLTQRWNLLPSLIMAFAEYEAIIIEAMRGMVVAGNYYVSAPPYEAVQYLQKSLDAIRQWKAYIGFHCYNSPRLSSSVGPGGGPADFTFRYHTWLNMAGGAGLYLVLVTEFGYDEIGGNGRWGWKTCGNVTDLLPDIYDYADPVFNQHPELVAVFWYRFGHDQSPGDDNDPAFKYDALDYASPPRADFDLARHIIERTNVVGEVPIPVPVPTPTPSPTPTPTPVTQLARVQNVDVYLNVRTGPSTSYASVGRLPNGISFMITDERVNGFRKVSGTSLWVSEAYLRLEA